ncbi:TPA: hypothetical protein N2883_004361 [Vibrio parahaemolyticus]|nr:hypothetical protein [Vibrio parahaemolyticus]
MIDDGFLFTALIPAVICLALARWRQIAAKMRREEDKRRKLNIPKELSFKHKALVHTKNFLDKPKVPLSRVLLDIVDKGVVWIFYISGSLQMLTAIKMVL